MIKVIIFDYGKVLGSDADEWNTTFKEIKKLTGLSSKKLAELFDKYWPKLKVGQELMKPFWLEVTKISKRKVAIDTLDKAYKSSVTVDQNVLSLAKKLKRKFKLVILSNESKEAMDAKIKKFKLNKIFSNIYCSANIGYAKPDPKIFEYALKDLNLKPNNALFIDNLERNIKAATQLGIRSILFQSLHQLKKDLSKTL